MAALLRSERARIVLLNASLFVLFACAWVADRWPSLAGAAIFLGFIVVIAEAAIFYFAKNALKKSVPTGRELVWAEESRVSEPAEVYLHPNPIEPDLVTFHRHTVMANRMMVHRQAILMAKLYKQRARASEVVTWALTDLEEGQARTLQEAERMRAVARSLQVWVDAKHLETWPSWEATRRPPSKELANWKLHHQGEEAFNITAGAFEIEHFHGRTNIRILDPSRVTVESERRGDLSPVAPAGLNPAIYN